jgi:Fe-S-cluster-containing hydrogenase component 2/CRP-like cAMP-binding protein
MTNPPIEDLFQLYESQYVSDLEGRIIRIEAAGQNDLQTFFTVTIDGQEVKMVPKAVPATDDQGIIKRDEDGLVVPRLTTVYDAVSWRYRDTDQNFPGPDPKNPVPVLCHTNHQNPIGVCRVCSVLTEKRGVVGEKLIPACQHPLVNGMQVHTVASKVQVKAPGEKNPIPAGEYLQRTVKVLLELLAVNSLHHDQPADNRRYRNELLDLCERFGLPIRRAAGKIDLDTPFRRRAYETTGNRIDDSSPIIRVDHNNCILCDRCVRGCSEVKPFKIIGHTGFGNKARVSFDLALPMVDSGCVSCGECAVSCPTGALTFKTSIYQDRDPWADEPLRPTTVKAEELEKQPLFAGVPYSFLKWNEGAVGKMEVKPGEILCRQGEYGSTAYLIEGGSVEVLVGDKAVVSLTRDDYLVGERAALAHVPRGATLRVGPTGATLQVVKRNMLHMLQRNRAARAILYPIYRQRALENYLRRGQLFAGLSKEQNQRCSKFMQERPDVEFIQVDPRQAVFRQGMEADSFYIISLGNVAIQKTNPHGHVQTLDYLSRGRSFGEIGLLSKLSPAVAAALPPDMRGRRTTTCMALDHVELVSISAEAFQALLNDESGIREQLEQKALELLRADPRRATDVGLRLLGEFTRTGLYQGQHLLVLDLERCTRCQECVKACANSHGDVTRLVLEGNRIDKYLVPSACRSCQDPACLTGCPVDAIHRRPDSGSKGAKSLAIFIEKHCIGCGLCANNCPFGSIHMLELKPGQRIASTQMPNNPNQKRIATNCDLCESLDGNPRCVHQCPHEAAIRLEAIDLAHRIGLAPAGTAPG